MAANNDTSAYTSLKKKLENDIIVAPTHKSITNDAKLAAGCQAAAAIRDSVNANKNSKRKQEKETCPHRMAFNG